MHRKPKGFRPARNISHYLQRQTIMPRSNACLASGRARHDANSGAIIPIGAWLSGTFKSIADGIAAVISAALFSQLPEFVQQYLQRLAGHRDEAVRLLLGLRAQGVNASNALRAPAEARATALTQAIEALWSAGNFTRPLVFFQIMEPEIARATPIAFQPAIPFTAESLVYAGIGVAVFGLLLHLLAAPFALLFGGRRHG
jgi:Protein of unknown function (DUF2937)